MPINKTMIWGTIILIEYWFSCIISVFSVVTIRTIFCDKVSDNYNYLIMGL